jgi:hypothetical protein
VSILIVRGWLDGVAYGLVADTDLPPHPIRGIVAQGPDEVIARVAALTGQPVLVTPTGPEVTVSLTDPLGLLAGLARVTEVVGVDGDLPRGWPDHPGEVGEDRGDAVY